jgi:4-hydroxy-2-oxoheptanedioate aldolase
MLKSNKVKSKLMANEEIFGILNSVPSAIITEMFAFAGYDFVIIDTEHLLFSPDTLEHAIRAAESVDLSVFVRVPSPCPIAITRALDAGAQGIVISRVSSLKEAQTAIQSCFYPPIGKRGITGGKNTGFGTIPLSEYIQQANQQVMLTLMIEDEEGVQALPEILKLDHIDMILEGALDLSLSMGHGTDFNHIEVQQAISTMAHHCAQSNVKFCAIPRLPGQLQQWREKEVTTFLAGEDRGLMFKALKQHLQQLKNQ